MSNNDLKILPPPSSSEPRPATPEGKSFVQMPVDFAAHYYERDQNGVFLGAFIMPKQLNLPDQAAAVEIDPGNIPLEVLLANGHTMVLAGFRDAKRRLWEIPSVIECLETQKEMREEAESEKFQELMSKLAETTRIVRKPQNPSSD